MPEIEWSVHAKFYIHKINKLKKAPKNAVILAHNYQILKFINGVQIFLQFFNLPFEASKTSANKIRNKITF